ncbi:Transcriptional regulatory protein LiaR [Lacunisphaera limnophila]|uniref:Transcriptional regulatory protein LiaR n=1 Tax=Lacunisphaera limnophila TaxID=1838286 RepID=A0A1D8ASR1_9BACT|nr:response regulator transcription factor [Lacunisphaera limnophila]AOS43934.1 Transcriptional regulatory protein LiaR [Lacunisphaera limnophila]
MITAVKKIRILLVDDHIVMRMGLVTATGGEPDMEVVAEADNGTEAIQAYRLHWPDVVVLDLRMPGLNGVETIRLLREEFRDARVLVFSNYAGGEEVFQTFRAGACGFVVKEMPLERLLEAIRKVHQGEHYIPAEISARLSGRVLSQLSSREVEVLTLIAQGLSNKEIAARLNLVEGTVKVHVTNILAKLHVSDRTQAILAGVKQGIIQLE